MEGGGGGHGCRVKGQRLLVCVEADFAVGREEQEVGGASNAGGNLSWGGGMDCIGLDWVLMC